MHISDKSALLGECRRVLRHDGRLAFTDWIAEALTGTERARLAETIAARDIESRDGYRTRLAAAGFVDVEDESLSVAWAAILRDRLEMYRGLESETVARFGREHHERYVANYAFFVELVEDGVLGAPASRPPHADPARPVIAQLAATGTGAAHTRRSSSKLHERGLAFRDVDQLPRQLARRGTRKRFVLTHDGVVPAQRQISPLDSELE